MDKEKAINVMKQMAHTVRGTLEEHKIIHASIEYLSKLEEPKEEKNEEKK